MGSCTKAVRVDLVLPIFCFLTMGLFAFRRMREREAVSNEAASLSIAAPKITEEPKPKKRRTVKPKLAKDVVE